MAAVTSLFLLFAVLQGNDGVGLTQLASFNERAACKKAASTVTAALESGTAGARVFCIRADALNSLKPR